MLKNYLVIALRTLQREKGHAAINLVGLSVGIGCFILVLLYVRYEFSYDRFHEGAERIYRIANAGGGGTYRGDNRFAVVPLPLADALRTQFPEVETATVFDGWPARIGRHDRHAYEHVLFADSLFFEVFTFRPVYGTLEGALRDPGSVVLTRHLAAKHFGDRNPVGETLTYASGAAETVTVTAVIEDVPANAHFTFDLVRRIQDDRRYEQALTQWGTNSFRSYVKLRPGYLASDLAGKLTRYAREQYARQTTGGDETGTVYFMQPLTAIHLQSHINFELGANGDIRYVYLFLAVGVIIVLIACINYVNLATARAARRGREIGVRKAVGAHRRQLVVQFLVESMLLVVLAFVLGLGLAYASLPGFNALVDRRMAFGLLADPSVGLILAGLCAAVGLIAGGYPAFVLARTRAVAVLKGTGKDAGRGGSLRRLLVVGQFTAAIILLIGGLIIYRQIDYLSTAKLGFNREQVAVIALRGALRDNVETVQQELARRPGVRGVSVVQYLPFNVSSQTTVDAWEGHDGTDAFSVYRMVADHAFLDVLQIRLLAGSPLPERLPEGETPYLINETAARQAGWSPEEAVGKLFGCDTCRVAGVVEDYHFLPLHQPMAPLMLYPSVSNRHSVLVRLASTGVRETVDDLKRTLQPLAPEEPLDVRFLDDAYDALYRSEIRFGQAVGAFTGLAVFIACLGLFGLASFMAQRRTKEIGIRKVLGATVRHVVVLLTREVVALVLVAFVVAAPIGYVVMSGWLDAFAYRVDLSPMIFLGAGLGTLGVALLTVSVQAYRAATRDPVKALRYE